MIPGLLCRAATRRAALLSLFLLPAITGCGDTRQLLTLESPATGLRYKLTSLPFTEYWSGVEFTGDPMGYGKLSLTPLADSFLIETRTELSFRMLDADKRSHYVTQDWVDANLQLQRFAYKYEMDDSLLKVAGHVAEDSLHATIVNAAGTHEQSLNLSAPVYPAAAQLLYPLLVGVQAGARYQYQVYDGESQRLNQVDQAVIAYEAVRGIPAWRIETTMNRSHSISWLDAHGLPIYEQAANGSIVARLISPAEAQAYLEDAQKNQDEALLNYSLVRTGQTIGSPRELHRMVIELTDLGDFILPTDVDRQQCDQQEAGTYICTIDVTIHSGKPPTTASLKGSLATNPVVPADHRRIQELAWRVAGDISNPSERITALIDWIRANIKSEAVDSFSALDVLEQGRGECQGQSFLYTALARALGIPTRIVNGLVYAYEHSGFLYHTWAESWDGAAWQSVDPTFGQVPADATHIALLYGENLADFAPLMELMGQLQASILEAEPG